MVATFVQSSGLATYVADIETGEVLMVNEAMCRFLKMKKLDIVGEKCWKFCNPSLTDFCENCPRCRLVDAGGMPSTPYSWKYYNELLRSWVFLVGHAAFWSNGRLVQIISTQDAAGRIPEAGLSLPGPLGDARPIAGDVQELVECGSLAGSGTTCLVDDAVRIDLICIDLSDLRMTRNAFGRETGQALLTAMLEWIAGMDFGEASLYHVDGDSYCLAVRNAGAEKAMRIARGLRARFSQPWRLPEIPGDMPFFCSARISVAHVEDGVLPGGNLADIAGRAIGSAKRHTEIFIHDAEADLREQRQLLLEASLKTCVNDGMRCFNLEYQPIVRLSDGAWRGLETLCRWNCPEYGTVPPAVFIPSAERQGLIADIGLWVLERAVRDAKGFGLDEADDFFLSINVSPIQMLDRDFPDRVSGILRRHRYPGKGLLLEITESAEVSLDGDILSVIEQMRCIDVRMALDDFGTGYASFNNLKNLPAHFIKTECEFIRGIENDDATQRFYSVMAELSHANGAMLIAEGVETPGELAAIRDSGADYGQGYLFARPMPRDELERRLDEFRRPGDEAAEAAASLPCRRDAGFPSEGGGTRATAPATLNLLNRVIQELLSDRSPEESFDLVLGMLGERFRLARAFFHIHMSGSFARFYEWTRGKGRLTKTSNRLRLPAQALTAEQIDILQIEGMVVIENASQPFGDAFAAFGSGRDCALALTSMWEGDRLLGMLGFEREEPGPWSRDVLAVLRSVGLIARSAIIGEHLKENVRDTTRRLLGSV